MQATASSKDLDSADIARRCSPETRYQLHGQSNGCPIRKLDLQCSLPAEVRDGDAPRLSFRGAPPGPARARKIQTPFLLYPVWYWHKVRSIAANQTLGLFGAKKCPKFKRSKLKELP